MDNICDSQLITTTTFMLNSFIHISILFAFLTFLFLNIIEPLSIHKFQEELDKIINEQIDKLIPEKIDLTAFNTNLIYRKKTLDYITNMLDNYNLNNDKNVTNTLSTITTINNFADYCINNQFFYQNIIDTYSSENFLIKKHNDYVRNNAYYLSIILIVITTIIIIMDKLSNVSCINLTKLFTENILTFMFVGGIEYWFFINYAFKFSPAPPSLLISSCINQAKNLL